MTSLKTTWMKIMGANLLAVGTFACGAPGEEPEGTTEPTPVPVSAESSREDIVSRTSQVGERLTETWEMMGESEAFAELMDSLMTPEPECETLQGDETETCTQPDAPDVVASIDEIFDGLEGVLSEQVFVDGNLESSTDMELVYLLDGATVCGAPEGDDPEAIEEASECASTVDQLEIRLTVTAPDADDLRVAVALGQAQSQLVTIDIGESSLGATVDLAQIKTALLEIDSSDEGLAEALPDVMKGKVRAELDMASAGQLAGSLGVLEELEVSDPSSEFHIKLAASPDALSAAIDVTASTLSLGADVNAVDIGFSLEEELPTEDEGAEPEKVSHPLAVRLGGFNGVTTIDFAAEALTLAGAGLGEETTVASIDGQEIVRVDVNPEDGRSFGLTASATEGGASITMDTRVHVLAAMSFANIAESWSSFEVPEWLADEQFSFDAAAGSELTLDEGGVRLAGGSITLGSQNGPTLEVGAGQCINVIEECEGEECPVSEEREGSHLLDALEVGACM